jgi:general secretion pathway protein D
MKIMRKYIIIISALFLFAIIAHAEVIETKENVQESNSAASVSNDSTMMVPQKPTVPKAKLRPQIPSLPVVETEKTSISTGNTSFKYVDADSENDPSLNTAPNTSISKTMQAIPPPMQTAVQQKSGIKTPASKAFPGNQPMLLGDMSSLNTAPTTSMAGTNPAIPPLSVATKNKTFNSRGSISLNFDDADIYSVIQTVFSEILKVNYIVDPKVKGRVTFRSVAPVPVDNVLPLMEVILRLNGVAVVEENSLYRIIPISELAREPSSVNIGRNAEKVEIKGKAILQVVPINYLQSSEIIKLITPFTSANAVIVDVPKTNHIIVVDTDANVKHLLQLINIFDSEQHKNKGPQVFVHHVQNGKAKDICALLQQIFLGSTTSVQTTTSNASKSMPTTTTASSSSAPVIRSNIQGTVSQGGRADTLVSDLAKIYADEILNAIIILGTPEDYEIIKGTIAKLDIVPRQVLIEGTIAQLQLTDKMSMGLAWSLQTNAFNMNPVTISFNPSSLSSDTSKTSGLSLIGIDSGGSVRAVINALASKSKAKLLASPHIMVSDNHEARIQVGQQVPLVTSETYGSSGTTSVPIRTIQYTDIGMILKVKPQINDSGLVALEISQEVSTYSKDTLYADETQIILNKTAASTNLVVQDGQTIVIGGLIREDDSRARSGIPFIYKIPLLGYLFGNTENEDSRTELVILLTPYVVKNQQDAKSVTNNFVDRVTDKKMSMEVKKGIKVKAEEQKKEVSK